MPRRTMSEKSSNVPHDAHKDERRYQHSREHMKAVLRKRDPIKLFTYRAIKRSIKWFVIYLFTIDNMSICS